MSMASLYMTPNASYICTLLCQKPSYFEVKIFDLILTTKNEPRHLDQKLGMFQHPFEGSTTYVGSWSYGQLTKNLTLWPFTCLLYTSDAADD